MAKIRHSTDRREKLQQFANTTRGFSPVCEEKSTDCIQPGSSFASSDFDRKSKAPHDQLRNLQDSLSTFFTPSSGRRSRQAPKKFEDEGPEKPMKIIRISNDMEDTQLMNPLQSPLTIDVNHEPVKTKSTASRRSSEARSPQRRACETLVDSLSSFFSVSSEKRRIIPRAGSAQIENSPGTSSSNCPSRDNEFSENRKKMSIRLRKSDAELKPIVGGRHTQNSASAALFGSPSKDDRVKINGSLSPVCKRPKLKHPSRSSSKYKEESDEDDKVSEEKTTPKSKSRMREKKKKKLSSAISPSGSTSGDKENISSDYIQDGQVQVTDDNRQVFEEARKRTQKLIDEAIQEVADRVASSENKETCQWPLAIRIRNFEIKTWYSAPYPQEYAHVAVLHICEYCLKYMRSEKIMAQHQKKCKVYRPPGNEIYRHNNVSVFEVDGNVSRLYCQNLCLLAKLFLDHKTLYYDVEPFLFYVVTTNDEYGQHFVGYFSKEKYSAQKFNLSCIVTLPCYQKQGFGRFLIDFSFLLSRREHMQGTPERPLSDLGRVSYASYWRTCLMEYMYNTGKHRSVISLADIARETGVSVYDVTEVFDSLRWFSKQNNGERVLEINNTMLENHWKKAKADKNRIWIHEPALKWVPVKHTPTKDFGVRSPVLTLTPQRSPMSTANVGSTPTGVSLAAVGSTVKKGASPKPSKKKAARQLKLSASIRPKLLSSSSEDSSSESDHSPNRKSCRTKSRGRARDKSSDDDESRRPDSKVLKKYNKLANESRVSSSNSSKKEPVSSSSKNRCTVSRGRAVFDDTEKLVNSNQGNGLMVDKKGESSRSDRKTVNGRTGSMSKRHGHHSPKKAVRVPIKTCPSYLPADDENGHHKRRSLSQRTNSSSTSVSPASSMECLEMRMRADSPYGTRANRGYNLDEELMLRSPSTSRATMRSSPTIQSSQRPSRSSHHEKAEPHSVQVSSVENTDDSRAASPCSDDESASNPADSPKPMGDRFPEHVNMGGIPDDDDEDDTFSRCAPSEESDQPPQLHAESATDLITVGGSSSSGETGLSGPPPLLSSEIGYNTDDDEAPPKLSPALISVPLENELIDLTEEERQHLALDQPPKAPVMIHDVGEEEMAYHTSVHNLIDNSGVASHHMMQQASTPLPTYPGSLHQATPDSVPSCHMSNQQTTPEMQAGQFMSPPMQQAMMQPSSVSSVHSAHNSSMEHVGPGSSGGNQSFPQMAPVAVPTDPAGQLHNPCLGNNSYGSPSTQNQPMRSSTDAVPTNSSNQRRSGEGSRKQRTQSQPQMQPSHQQLSQQFAMQAPFYNPQYPAYPGYGFDPTAFPSAHSYFPPAYQYGKAAATNTAMGNMMQAPMIYNYQNNMAPNMHQQVSWPRYPAAGPVPTFPASANPGFPPAPYFGASNYSYFQK
ncbi:unnamed protein product [Auanema sp. JU1783]|nr:unnamed protein product [Auanema sp. JU1783]